MKSYFDENRPIFQQIQEMIEDDIMDNRLLAEAQVPSTTELSKTYRINPATVRKGLQALVDGGIIYKKKGNRNVCDC